MYEVDTIDGPRPWTADRSPAPERPGAPVDQRRLWVALVRGRGWFAAALLGGVAMSVPVGRALAPYEYQATAAVVWQPPPGMEDASATAERELQTMVDQIELPVNLARIKARLGLPDPLPVIGKSISVLDFDVGSNVITVAAVARRPEAAALRANTAVDVFLEHRARLERARQRDVLAAIDSDLDRARLELGGARRAHDAFRVAHGIADLSLDTQQAIERAAALRAQAEIAGTDAASEAARAQAYSRAATRRGGLPAPATAPPAAARPPTADEARLQRARLELSDARSRFTDEHPTVQGLLALVSGLERSVAVADGAAPAPRPSGGTPAPVFQNTVAVSTARQKVALDRERNLRTMAEAAERALERLSSVEGQASTLLAAQRVAEAHVAELSALRARAKDAARMPSAGLELIARAAPPEHPVSRARRVIVAAATPFVLVLGLFLGILGGAVRGLRAWTAREVAWWGRAPVVGSSTWPREPQALVALLAELEDVMPRVAGATLVVGATAADTDLVRDLADVLDGFYAWPGPASEDGGGPRPNPPAETEGARVVSSALFRIGERDLAARAPDGTPRSAFEAWVGPATGPSLRRACRLADRVLVVVRSGSLSFATLGKIPGRLGRREGIAYLVVGLRKELARCADRAGQVTLFWRATRFGAGAG